MIKFSGTLRGYQLIPCIFFHLFSFWIGDTMNVTNLLNKLSSGAAGVRRPHKTLTSHEPEQSDEDVVARFGMLGCSILVEWEFDMDILC
jgi:hypothetical protein